MPRATVNGYEIHYEISGGEAGGPDVLWVHGGYGGIQSHYAPRTHFPGFDHVARNFQADRRSCYRSETRLDPYTLDDTIEDLRRLLDVARAETGGFERPILIGSSAGGPPALGFALKYQDQISALGLLNTGPCLMPDPAAPVAGEADSPVAGEADSPEGVRRRLEFNRKRLAPADQMKAEGIEAAFAAHRQQVVDGLLRGLPADREADMRAVAPSLTDDDLRLYWGALLLNMDAYRGYDYTARLGEITLPVLLVHGTADETVPFEYSLDLQAGIPHAEFFAVEGAGHGISGDPVGHRQVEEWITRVSA